MLEYYLIPEQIHNLYASQSILGIGTLHQDIAQGNRIACATVKATGYRTALEAIDRDAALRPASRFLI